ncbi:hypothetical protein LZ575_02785 [Antarcticibacterium sp. 1MA-6-2]|uniref:hypothetical protein n=1 Tax=Antarcticibacterium sp. 1MA-6-2 TaxID=2908210 RepID=UPI001F39F0CD|nr:hypothetical protein [Antarcticibacterium sp. 1MA-6-2]UJH91636.1 hypothetical protein LZ575_02785 [Antarcticibacterium sp. 1MA-6-2]
MPENLKDFNTVILSDTSKEPEGIDLKRLLGSTLKKIVILDPDYSYRWILDYNFEIAYRQNEVVMLKKVE